MDAEFWHERWERGQTGFDQDQVNERLAEHWDLVVAGGERGRVFVPLCGKSVDMRWLASRGWEVLGVDLSPIAVRDFFAAGTEEPQRTPDGAFERWTAGPVTLLCGDFFALDADHVAGVDAVYDRAALIALPELLRRRYVRHLLAIVPSDAPILAVTLEYDQREMNGPPFSVTEDEVRRLFAARRRFEHLGRDEVLDGEPRLRSRGLSRLAESVYLIA